MSLNLNNREDKIILIFYSSILPFFTDWQNVEFPVFFHPWIKIFVSLLKSKRDIKRLVNFSGKTWCFSSGLCLKMLHYLIYMDKLNTLGAEAK